MPTPQETLTPPRKQPVLAMDRGDLASHRYLFLERYMRAKQANNDKSLSVIEFTNKPPSVVSPSPQRQTANIMHLANVCEQERSSLEEVSGDEPRSQNSCCVPPKKRKLSL
jgi:hypothetical protein